MILGRETPQAILGSRTLNLEEMRKMMEFLRVFFLEEGVRPRFCEGGKSEIKECCLHVYILGCHVKASPQVMMRI